MTAKRVSSRKLRVVVVGGGRQGKVHAHNFAFACPNAELLAVVDSDPSVRDWISHHISPDLPLETDMDSLYRRFNISAGGATGSGGLDAVIISTSTDSHATLTVSAIDHGLHVLLEKPVAIDLPSHSLVLEASRKRPDVNVVVGLMRRFDPSYRQAMARVQSGEMGGVCTIKSATVDLYDPAGSFVSYAEKSGGIWIDCGIHDIDIARWFMGLSDPLGGTRVSSVYAVGFNARYPELAQHGDVDTTYGLIQLSDGRTCAINLGRTATHGHECTAEIHCSQGRMVVNQNPALDRNTIQDQHGVRALSTASYFERFKEAFIVEACEFVEHCLHSAPIAVTLQDAVAAAQIATGLAFSLRSGQVVHFDQDGNPVVPESSAGADMALASKPIKEKL